MFNKILNFNYLMNKNYILKIINTIQYKHMNPNKTNIQKKTLESEDFYLLVKNKIEKTNNILKLSNQ